MAGIRSLLARLNPAIALVKAALQTAGRHIHRGLPLVIGEFRWKAPAWIVTARSGMTASWGWLRTNRARAVQALVAILAIGVIGIAGKHWYDSRPRPIEVKFSVSEPPVTRYDLPQVRPQPMMVHFSASAAPLNLVGKEVPSGVDLSPRLDGRWTWEDDRTLKFEPKTDWPVGETFSVSLAREGFVPPHVHLADYGFKFKSAPFAASVGSAEFYQDPVEPALKKVVVSVKFSHPVDPAQFEKRISMAFAGQPGTLFGLTGSIKYNVIYDKLKLTAFIHSDRLEIPTKTTSLITKVAAGITAGVGGRGTAYELDKSVNVPGLYSLGVTDSNLMLVDNERLEPEQVMLVSTSADVLEKDFQSNVTAWVLPLNHPDQKPEERTRPYPWSDASKIGPEILKLATPLKLESIPAERDHASQHGFKYQGDVGRYVYMKVNKGIKSYGGYLMGADYDRILRVPPYPQELKIMHNGALLALSGDRKVSVFTRDLPGLRVEIGRVLPTQIQNLVTQTGGAFTRPQFNYGQLGEDNLTERFTEVITLPERQHGRPYYQPVDLGGYLDSGDGVRRGIFFLKVAGYDPSEKRTTGKSDARFVVVTDLGLLVKKSLDGSQDVFVQSIRSGNPVGGATVEVIGLNGLPVLTQTTDEGGHVRFPNLADFQREKQPVLYLARRGGDVSFLPLNRGDRNLDFSRFDVGGVANTIQSDVLSAYMFSDRGIYRPGDASHVGMIVRAADWTRSLAGLPLEATVTDPRGLVIKREKLKLSSSGFEELSFKTEETSPTGSYNVGLYIVKDGQPAGQIGSTAVRVQEFQPDRMKMSVRLSAESVQGWVSPKDLKARVVLQNLFGTPATNRRVRAEMSLSPTYPSFSGFRDYRFYDPQRAKESYNEPLTDATTDEKGEAAFDLNLDRFAAATYRLSVLAQGFEAQGGRGVTAETGTLVSLAPYLVGYKADGDLGYVARAAKRSVDIIAIDPKAQRTGVDNLTISQIERRYVSVLTRQESGLYKYESKRKEIVVSTQPFSIAAKGTPYTLPTGEPGDYSLVVRNADGGELARVEYTVAGRANLTRSLDKNAELEITLNKRDFAPGEEIEMQIKAPYTGAGLITVEREKVYHHQWFKTSTTSSVQRIRLPSGLEGNGYLSVAFIRDPGSDEIYASPLSYGVVPFSISLEKRKTDIEVTTPDLVKPGDKLHMRYRTDTPARIVLFAVDEGILQVAGYRNADPLGYFFQKRALDVKTSQILDLILPEFGKVAALNAAPGGDAEAAIGRNLNPFKRKRDKPVVFWSGIVDASPEDKEVSFTVPDYFNGTLRVMAVAVADRAMGVFEKKAVVRGDFVLSPNVPTTVAPGDEFEVSVGVANNVQGSGPDAAVALALQTSDHLEVLGSPKTDLKIGEMREGSASFRVRARDKLGSASLQFQASSGNKSGKFSVDLSVRPAVPYRTWLAVGGFKEREVTVPTARQMYAEYRTLEASASVLPLAMAHGLVSYLGNFSYSCTEQLVSQGMPAVVLGNRPEFGYVRSTKGQNLTELIAVLRARQNGEGAYALWAANHHVSEFASVYAQHFLLEARERGIAVPGDMLTSGNSYLQQLAGSEGDDLHQERVRAYAIYLLTRQGVVTSSYAQNLQKRLEAQHTDVWRQDLAGVYLAAAYKLMKQDRLADGIIGKSRMGERKGKGYEMYYDGLIHDAVLLYILSRHFPDQLYKLPPEALTGMAEQIQRGSYNTLSSGYTLLAFDAYVTATGKFAGATFTAGELLKDGRIHNLDLPAALLPKVAFTPEATAIRFTKGSDLPGFYLVNQSGFDRALPTKEIKNGLELLREYTDATGKPVTSIKLGDEVEVHLKFRAVGRNSVGDLAIVDLLPGGFEVVLEPMTTNDVQTRPGATAKRPVERASDDSEERSSQEEEGDSEAQRAEHEDDAEDSGWQPPIGSAKSSWRPEYADIREDRIVLYGSVGSNVAEFVYKIKATNRGTFAVPPTFGESMYDRSIEGRSLGGKLIVEK